MLKPNNLHFLTLLVLTVTLIFSPIFLLKKEKVMADEFFITDKMNEGEFSTFPIYQETTLLPLTSPILREDSEKIKRIKVLVTAYSSSVWETQGDPFITASGNKVRDGIVANNKYPFGTKVRFPEIYGDKIFIVEDRMHSRKGPYQFDIWMDSYEKAKNFGAKIVEAEIFID